jgi:hypothetical protein
MLVSFVKSNVNKKILCFLMEDKQNMWELWYLITLGNMVKMECRFWNNVISYHKD